MKLRLGRGAAIAAGAVAASLFVLLCMLFYGKQDYLSPERILARGDALRFRIASIFVEPFGAGAYLAFGIAFAWSVVAYFRESVGALLPRIVGVAACIPSFCALTSLVSSPHEFWAGSVGVWTGDIVHRGFGPVLGIGVLGTLFLVSFAMATQFGFYTQFASLRGSLSFPLLPPEEATSSQATAVLEPGQAEPVESWMSPEFSVEPVEAPAEEADEFSDANLLDREEHVADIRRRLSGGEPVTEAERKLVVDAEDQAAVADAVNALFAAPAPAPEAGSPPAFVLPEVPPFLLAPSAPPLLSQEILADAPALPPAAIQPAAPVEAAPAAAAKIETEEFEAIDGPMVVLDRAPHIFSAVEFLPPNEELADPYAPAPAVEPAAPAPVEEPAPAASIEPAAAAPAPATAPGTALVSYEDEFFAFGFEDEAPAAVVEEPVAVVETPVVETPAVVAPVEAPVVETPAIVAETPAEENHGAASALLMTAPAEETIPAEVPAGVFSAAAPAAAPEIVAPAPVSAADAHGAAVESVFPSPAADDGAWLLAAAKDLGLEVVEEDVVPYAFPALEPTPDREPHTETNPCIEVHPFETLPPSDSHPDEVLARLFGEPVVRTEIDTGTPGPAQSEPREPPANLMPFIEEIAERVTLLSDPIVDGCLADHGIDLSSIQEVVVAPNEVTVDDDGPVTEDLSAEEAAEAIVASLSDLFGEPVVDDAPAAPAPVDTASLDALDAHGWGTLFPFMFPEGTQAAAEDHQAPDDGSRVPAHAPPPVMDMVEAPVEAVVAEAPVVETPVVENPVAENPVAETPVAETPVVEVAETPAVEMVEVPAVEVVDSVLPGDADAAAEETMDEALVSRLVEELKSESPAAPAAEPEVEAVPAVVLPEPAAAPVQREGRDELYEKAVAAVRERGRGSVVVLQRKLGIGFTRATNIIEELVGDGILGPENASGSHPVL